MQYFLGVLGASFFDPSIYIYKSRRATISSNKRVRDQTAKTDNPQIGNFWETFDKLFSDLKL